MQTRRHLRSGMPGADYRAGGQEILPVPDGKRRRVLHQLRTLRSRLPAWSFRAFQHADRRLPPRWKETCFPTPGAFKHFLLARRSIRRYKKTPVSRKVLAELIDAARYAPTASNKQQVYWTVISGLEDVRKMAVLVIDFMKVMLPLTPDEDQVRRYRRIIDAWDHGRDRIAREAPHMIVAHSPADMPFPAADCAIALTYLELYACARGLGTCWAGYFTAAANLHAPLIQALGLPAGHQLPWRRSCWDIRNTAISGFPNVMMPWLPGADWLKSSVKPDRVFRQRYRTVRWNSKKRYEPVRCMDPCTTKVLSFRH